MDTFWNDLKYSARTFLQTPGFTVSSIAALALGIAANTAIFSVVSTVLLKPFAYRDPDRIVMFQNTVGGVRFGSAAHAEFNWWRQQTQSFQDISAYGFSVANWTRESFPELIPAMRVSAGFFRLCGTAPVRGRTFTAADDLPRAPKTAVLAYAFWQQRFAGDPRVIGRYMTLSGERYEIIGILGQDLQNGQIAERSTLAADIEINEAPGVYLPFHIDPNSGDHGHYLNVAARLRPGVIVAAANEQLQASYREYARKWPDDDFPGRGFSVEVLQDAIVSRVRGSLLLLLGAVGLVLLIACANVANLLLARAAGRRREIAIRVALGAGRGRIVRQLLTESLMLSLGGGVLGLAAGYAGMRAILTLLPGNIPRLGAGGSNVTLDWRVLGFTLAVSVAAAIVFGLVPALESSRADLSRSLNQAGPRGATSLRHNRTGSLLVTAEMALALVLLIGAGLLIRSFAAIRHLNPGFDPHHVLTMRMALAGPRFDKPANVAQVIREGLRRIRGLPGVEAAAVTCCVTLEDRWQVGFQIAGRTPGPSSEGIAGSAYVSAGYFETFRIPLLRGRFFTERDETGPPVAIINQTLAKRFWPDSDPLNGEIVFGGVPTRRRIIGVVADVRDDFLTRDPRPNIYEPSGALDGFLAWVIRTRETPLPLVSAIRKELREASGGLPVARVRSMDEIVSRSLVAENFNTLVLVIFGGSALVLAAIGIYGLMAYSVAQRTREIGIRLALGAGASRIRNMVVVQGLRPALAGVVGGLAAAFFLTRLMTSLLFGVKAWDLFVFVAVPVALAGVALIAAGLPALRASRVNPVHALRHE